MVDSWRRSISAIIEPSSSRSERVEGCVEREARILDFAETSCSLANVNEDTNQKFTMVDVRTAKTR